MILLKGSCLGREVRIRWWSGSGYHPGFRLKNLIMLIMVASSCIQILNRALIEPTIFMRNKGLVIFNGGWGGGWDSSNFLFFFVPLQFFFKKFHTPTKISKKFSYPYKPQIPQMGAPQLHRHQISRHQIHQHQIHRAKFPWIRWCAFAIPIFWIYHFFLYF